MRLRRMVVVIAGLGVALAGCTDSGDNAATPGASTSGGSGSAGPGATGAAASSGTASSAPPGVAASCTVGSWKASGFEAKFDQSGASGTATGGGGIGVTIAANGATSVDFAGMKPVTFRATARGIDVEGNYTYGGKVNGTVNTPAGAATSGAWQPTGTVDFGSVTVSLSLTAPVQTQVANNLPIAQYLGASAAEAGNAVEGQPILQRGTFTCSGNTLKITSTAGPTSVGGTWTLQKA